MRFSNIITNFKQSNSVHVSNASASVELCPQASYRARSLAPGHQWRLRFPRPPTFDLSVKIYKIQHCTKVHDNKTSYVERSKRRHLERRRNTVRHHADDHPHHHHLKIMALLASSRAAPASVERYSSKPSLEIAPTTIATIFLMWSSTLTHDLDLRTWPRDCQDEPARQIFRSRFIEFKSCCPGTCTHTYWTNGTT